MGGGTFVRPGGDGSGSFEMGGGATSILESKQMMAEQVRKNGMGF